MGKRKIKDSNAKNNKNEKKNKQELNSMENSSHNTKIVQESNDAVETVNKYISEEKKGNKKRNSTSKLTETQTKQCSGEPQIKTAKNIVFEGDEPIEIPASLGHVDNSKKKNKKLNQDEEEVKEEDIDKFCNEIDEEDNKQYENWIKLLEEKLNPKKNK